MNTFIIFSDPQIANWNIDASAPSPNILQVKDAETNRIGLSLSFAARNLMDLGGVSRRRGEGDNEANGERPGGFWTGRLGDPYRSFIAEGTALP